MKRVLKSRLSIFAAFAVVAAAGCGGSGSNPVPSANGGLNFAGAEIGSTTSTETVAVPPTGGVTVTTGAGDVLVPSGAAAVTAGGAIATLPAGIGFPGTYAAGSSLRVNGVTNSGAGVGTNGFTAVTLGLPVTEAGTAYTLEFPAGSLDTSRVLTVGSIVFSGAFYYRSGQIISPVPTSVTGTIPNNGQNAVGSEVLTTYGAGNNGRSANLRIVYGNGFVLNQTRTIANNRAVFSNLTTDTTSVPASGVQSVTFTVGNL